eukprot:gene44524-44183_t
MGATPSRQRPQLAAVGVAVADQSPLRALPAPDRRTICADGRRQGPEAAAPQPAERAVNVRRF